VAVMAVAAIVGIAGVLAWRGLHHASASHRSQSQRSIITAQACPQRVGAASPDIQNEPSISRRQDGPVAVCIYRLQRVRGAGHLRSAKAITDASTVHQINRLLATAVPWRGPGPPLPDHTAIFLAVSTTRGGVGLVPFDVSSAFNLEGHRMSLREPIPPQIVAAIASR
jgi:hypothetical protein